MKIAGKILYWIVLGGIIAVALLVMFSSTGIGGAKMYYVSSPSMEPTISAGSLIFVKPESEYAVGDVVTKSTTNKEITVTHRVHEIGEEDGQKMFTLKGDANEIPDEGTITQRAIIGKVFFWLPYLGHLVAFAKEPLGFVLIVVIPVTIIVYDEILNLRNEFRKRFGKKGGEIHKDTSSDEDDDTKA